MAVEVKRGGRTAFTCGTCGLEIPAKTPHLRGSGKPFKRYHQGCFPIPGAETIKLQ